MILLGEITAAAREAPFYLPQSSNPALPVLGHSFSLGEVEFDLPGSSYTDVPLIQLAERGYGIYVVLPTQANCAAGGNILVAAVVSGAQTWTGSELVTRSPGGIAVGETSDPARSIAFHLALAADGSPITAHTWMTGELKIWVPGDVAWSNADVTRVSNDTNGDWSYALTDPQVAARGKVYLAIDLSQSGVSTYQNMATWVDVVALGGGAVDAPVVDFTAPTPNTTPGAGGGMPTNYATASSTPITLQITDDSGESAIAYVGVTVSFQSGPPETAYRAGTFTSNYMGSTSQPITNGIQLSLLRVEGWPGAATDDLNLAVTLLVDVIDSSGELHTFQASYEMPLAEGIAPPPPAAPVLGARDVVAGALGRLIWQFSSDSTGDTL